MGSSKVHATPNSTVLFVTQLMTGSGVTVKVALLVTGLPHAPLTMTV